MVLGGGPIGCELAQSFARLGSAVTQVEMAPRIMVREDPEVSASWWPRRCAPMACCRAHRPPGECASRCDGRRESALIAATRDAECVIAFDELLCAVGRSPRVTGYGLEELGIPLTRKRKTIETNAWLQTLYPNIYAVGDVAGPFQFTHTAAHQAWYAAVNALFGRFKRFKADLLGDPLGHLHRPRGGAGGPERGRGQGAGRGLYEVTKYGIDDLDRAIADGTAHGFVKVLT